MGNQSPMQRETDTENVRGGRLIKSPAPPKPLLQNVKAQITSGLFHVTSCRAE
jgi:hypothetical protein